MPRDPLYRYRRVVFYIFCRAQSAEDLLLGLDILIYPISTPNDHVDPFEPLVEWNTSFPSRGIELIWMTIRRINHSR